MLDKFRKKIYRRSRQTLDRAAYFQTYAQWMGWDNAILFKLARLNKQKELKHVRTQTVDLYLRTCTPDLNVAADCLLFDEYGHIKSNNPAVIIDGGANIGASSIYFAKAFPNAKIFAIEPEEENFEILLLNTRQYPNVIPIKAALWSTKESRPLLDRHTGPWGYTVSDTENASSQLGQNIECITIDSLMEEYGIEHIDILKLDIEGGEKAVLETSSAWIDKVDIMIVELHESIAPGCTRAFYLATQAFGDFEKFGEKITAYRESNAA